MNRFKQGLLFFSLILLLKAAAMAQNPLITTQFTADPSARVFGDKVYLYPSHDILATPGHGRLGWFCMQDYHVFSSPNLVDWTDHGMIVSQYKVNWVDSNAYSMWAPDCIDRNGKFYFYFPSQVKATYGRGFAVGVAVSDKPYGPFIPQPDPIKGVHGIDPNVFIDKDGQAYLYWAGGNIYAAKLKENMLELASEPKILTELPTKGLKEGPYLFERKGIYYLTYPHVADKIERLEYATSNSPLGPFKFTGVLMDESASGCWTNHQSIIEFKNQYYLFYHDDDLSPQFNKNRSVHADSLFFNEDGTIKKVIPTLRGVGITKATHEIQIDRYSSKDDDVTIAFLDTANKFKGWQTVFNKPNEWIRYNSVDFGAKKLTTVNVRAWSKTGGTLQIRLNSTSGPIISSVQIPKGDEWKVIKAPLSAFKPGVHHLFVSIENNGDTGVDWLKFN
jgi:hypothetical protein